MSTYTDLHNRVKESLTVDYNTRVTTQKISAMNEENLFVGTFRGAFGGGSISQVSCIDCTMLSGLAKQQLMVDPLLSVGYNPQTQEPIISSLIDYIGAHGGGSGYLTSADVIPEQLTCETVKVATIGGKSIYAPKSQQGVTDPLYVNDLSAGHSLSCRFDSVYDIAQHQLSDLLDELGETTTVLNICLRVNEIKSLADLADVPEIDYTTDKVSDLFAAVEKIAPARVVRTFAEVVESLNLSLSELKVATTGVSLESRLRALSNNISIVITYVNRLSSDFSSDIAYLSSQISSISPATEARLASAERRITTIESDYLKQADKASLQSQISLKASTAEVTNKIETEKKQFCQLAYNALSALPADPQVLDIDTVSKVLFDIRSLFAGLK